MAPCGRVRSRCPGPALLLLLALAARPAAGGLPPAGLAAAGGGPALAGQPAGPGAAGPRGPRGGGGSGSGWKLSEEAVCREDVVRLCSKHSWANNLAVLECLQDVREVRGRAGPTRGGEQRAGLRAPRPRRRRSSAERVQPGPPFLLYPAIFVTKAGVRVCRLAPAALPALRLRRCGASCEGLAARAGAPGEEPLSGAPGRERSR